MSMGFTSNNQIKLNQMTWFFERSFGKNNNDYCQYNILLYFLLILNVAFILPCILFFQFHPKEESVCSPVYFTDFVTFHRRSYGCYSSVECSETIDNVLCIVEFPDFFLLKNRLAFPPTRRALHHTVDTGSGVWVWHIN